MAENKEVWIEPGDDAGLFSGEPSTVILRGEPRIHFLRGRDFAPFDKGRYEYSTPCLSPVPKNVLAHWKKAGKTPESASVIRIAVEAAVSTGKPLKLKVGGKTQELELEPATEGFVTKDFVLFASGDGGLEAFDGIKVIDVSKGDGIEAKVEVDTGSEKRDLGLIDFLLKDPADGKFRTARYGIFKTRNPEFKLVFAGVGANDLEIILDDGDDATVDSVDITKLVDPQGEVTEKPGLPDALEADSDQITGEWDPHAARSRFYDAPTDAAKPLALFLFGENRIVIKDKFGGEVIFTAHFILFEDEESTIPGTTRDLIPVNVGEKHMKVGKGQVMVTFKDKTKPKDMSALMHAFFLNPQGISGSLFLVQGKMGEEAETDDLIALVKAIRDYKDANLEDADFNHVFVNEADPKFVAEAYPRAIRGEFRPRTAAQPPGATEGTFTTAHQWYFHHFYLHTFPAHRLIDKIRFPDAEPPAITLQGSHFELDKSFLMPSARDTMAEVQRAKQSRPQRKMAVFGHTDALGTDTHNNGLSKHRATMAHALLIKDPDPWLRRLDGSAVANELAWGNREIQYMLKSIGLYTGPIDGQMTTPTRQAGRDFLARHSLPASAMGTLNTAAKRRLIQDYMDWMLTNALVEGDFFRDTGNLPAVFGCGKAFLLVPGSPNDGVNRRVTFVMRMAAAAPVDVSQVGAAVPYALWITPEPEAAARADVQPPFVVGCHDNGFGLNDDFRANLDGPNRWLIKGRRIVRPTIIDGVGANNVTIFEDGDLGNRGVPAPNGNSGINDNHSPSPPLPAPQNNYHGPHGSGVMTCMVCNPEDGNEIGGNRRTAQETVLGTGKDLRFRPIKHLNPTFQALIRSYEILAADPEVKVVSSSLLIDNVTNMGVASQTQLRTKMTAMLNSDKLYFIAAANNGWANPERDVARTEGGMLAPARTVSRGTLPKASQLIATVGASTHVLDPAGTHVAGQAELPTTFTYLGAEVSLSAPGENIRIIAPNTNAGTSLGGAHNADGVEMSNINGTSFATPMTAGMAGELLLANPRLQDPARMPMVIEILEATADNLPSLNTATRAWQRGPYLPAPATYPVGEGLQTGGWAGAYPPGYTTPDPQLVAGDLAGYRRVNFWKAVLASVNEGLPAEITGGDGTAHAHFTTLTGKNHAATKWYGFEIRSPLPECTLWLKRADGSFVPIEDTGATLPGNRVIASTWRKTQDYKAPSAHIHAGFVLPAFPFEGNPPVAGSPAAQITFFWMCQFSFYREELDRYAELHIFAPGATPSQPGVAAPPPVAKFLFSKITDMRNPTAITGGQRTTDAALDQVATHIEEFDDFVFHVTIKPLALHAFAIRHAAGANLGEEITATLFAVDKFGNIKPDYAGTVTLSHNGTAGALSGTTRSGVFINGAAAPVAGVPLTLVNGRIEFRIQGNTLQNIQLHAAGDGKSDDGSNPVLAITPPGALGSFRLEFTRWDAQALADHPFRAGDRIKCKVTALDTQDRAKTDFDGRIDLRVVEGRMGSDTPRKNGIHVANAETDAFNASAFTHTFLRSEQGVFEYSLFDYTAGLMVLQVVHNGSSSRGPDVDMLAGIVDAFDWTVNNTVAAGNALNVEIRARDKYGNNIADFAETVDLAASPVGMAAGTTAGARTGVYILNTATVADHHLRFSREDQGTKRFQVTPYTAGTFKLQATSPTITTASETPDITVTAAAAVHHFDFTAAATQAANSRFPITVKAMDSAGNLVPDFTGSVSLTVVSGPLAAPLLHTPHTYAAGDRGSFAFEARSNGAGAAVVRAISGTVSSDLNLTIV